MAHEGATLRIAKNETEWETIEGLPAWIVIPKLVPIGWKYDFYKRCCDLIQAEKDALMQAIEARRRARGEDV